MAYSDDEAEPVIKSVSNYYFVDTKEEPISFSVLPLFDNKGPKKSEKQVFMHGKGDGGLQKVYKQVTSWKLKLEKDEQPEIMMLTKDKKWIQLAEPRKSYMDTVRTVMITAHVLHFLKRKPHSSGKTLWGHVNKVLRTLKGPPSVKDLRDHYPLIRLLMERDPALAKSEWLLGFLKEKPGKKPFTVEDDPKEDVGSVDGDEEDLDLFDTVCAICDNGGKLLCCEGRCMRSFHATREDGEESNCKSLGFSRSQVEASQKFLCKNCKYNQHQCFVCGKLGSSDNRVGVEVFSCVKLTCGHFYHPKCVADLLFQKNKTKAAECEKKIAAGEPFTCPVHKCNVCKQGENREVEESQFAVCRRCPKSYHRKCLPREIAFENIEEEGIVQRAWEFLLPDRILIFCLEHKIVEDLQTPSRNHVTFPEIAERKTNSNMKKSKEKVLAKNNRQVSDYLPQERTSINLRKETEKLFDYEEQQFVVQNDCNNSDGSVPLDCKMSPKEKESAMMEKIEEAPPAVTQESILKNTAVPSTHMYAVDNINKRITLGELKNSSEAVNTSFGRCFTKVDKLQQIVHKLHWYVQNDDMIVDFCCGANDFSRLMKEKLDEAGKRCSFKNYDFIRPKDDFNYEKKDWMKVEPQEIPTGSKLIMGLSSPFGVDPSLANEFIDKALTFKPKLLILVVPSGTQKLDSKSSRYQLIWEDCKLLSGKSFYMPGSVNEDDMQIEQWNLEPLSLYLWSRADWTTIYKAIALQRGHASTVKQEPTYEERTQSQVVHPPKKRILERHGKEVAIAKQATTKEVNKKKIAVESKRKTSLVIDNNFGRKRREATTVQEADRRNAGETHISPPETRDSNRYIYKSRHPLEPSETPTTKDGNNEKTAIERKNKLPLIIGNNFGRETTSVQGHASTAQQKLSYEERTQAQSQVVHPPKKQILERHEKEVAIAQQATTKEVNKKKIAVESKKRTSLVFDNNFGRKRRRETTAVRGADRRNEGETHISPPETRDSNRYISKSRHPLEPFETPTTEEGNNGKIAVESKTRTPLVIDNNFSRKRETATVQGADRRNERETHISSPETRVSNRDISKSQHPLEPSETSRKTFPMSLIGAQRSRSSLDASGFAAGPVHTFPQHSSCGWLDD